MTTLSKEEFKLLLSNSVASPDLDKVQDAIADLVAENGLTKLALSQKIELLKSCEQALDKSYAENERLKMDNEALMLQWDTSESVIYQRDKLRDQLTATRTALAAAEAREDSFRSAVLVQGLQLHADKTKSELKDEINRLFPADDSALCVILKEAKFEGRQELLQFIRYNNYVCTKPGIITGAQYKLYFLPEE